MKKRGFTLIELLAVIVVLAIVALISVPLIIGVIEKSKEGSLKASAYGLIETAGIYYAGNLKDGMEKEEFTFLNGKQTSEKKLEYKGKVEKGSVRLYSDGKVAVCIEGGDYVAVKNVNEEEVLLKKGRCIYNSVTEEYETLGLCKDLEDELTNLTEKYNKEKTELINEYEGKQKTLEETYKNEIEELRKQLTELKDNYESKLKTQQETYEQQIEAMKKSGTATASEILKGKTAYSNGQLQTGSMANNGAITSSLNAGGSYTIPAGYHSGGGKVTANSLASQTSSNAVAANITNGKTAWVNGVKITGTGVDNTTFYNNGVAAADARVNTASASYTSGYNAGRSNAKIDTYIINLTPQQVNSTKTFTFDLGKTILGVGIVSINQGNVYSWQQNYNAYISISGLKVTYSGTVVTLSLPWNATGDSGSGRNKTPFNVTIMYAYK